MMVPRSRLLPEGLSRSGNDYVFAFTAMATPCEVRIETDDIETATIVGHTVRGEALRIEQKYSRYRKDSTLSALNTATGRSITVDEETASLLDFASQCYAISDGLFDVTSGVLRRAWIFDGSDRIPSERDIAEVLLLVGWDKVFWKRPTLRTPSGMEIDFGGIGKEYAVDRATAIIGSVTSAPALVNFGGDMRVTGPRVGSAPWNVAIESVDRPGELTAMLELRTGALATSGGSQRFLLKDGIRYGHILDPRNGKPIADPPRSVTVAAATCTEAGMFSTMAILNGSNAEAFLEREGVSAWCIR